MGPRFKIKFILFLIASFFVAAGGQAKPLYALALGAQPKYPANFSHFDYANPEAPKGGTVRLAAIGSFNSLNSFILKGDSAPGLGMIYDTLMVQSADEPFTAYGLIAESIDVSDDRTSVKFALRKEAKFHDGSPITADDVVFTFDKLRAQGHPSFKIYYKDVASVKALNPHLVEFKIANPQNREMPLILAQLAVLPKAYYDKNKFDAPTLTPPLGSGPYEVASVVPGRSITYHRVKDYWAQNLPVNRGRFNFDEITYDIYLDPTVALEAFKAGAYDFREENIAKDWAKSYNFPAIQDGRVVKQEIHHQNPTGMQGFFMNLRRPLFQDRRVREALNLAFDYEWMNKAFFFNSYKRSSSYFSNSDLAAEGLPKGRELEILKAYQGQLEPEVLTQVFENPVSDGSGMNRKNLVAAKELLDRAGYHIVNQKLIDPKTKKPVQIEFLLANPSFSRVIQAYVRNLAKLGIEAKIRLIDGAGYQQRTDHFDFDIIVHNVGQSLSPGNEQLNYWGSSEADHEGSANILGLKSPVVDDLVNKIIHAKDRSELVALTHALDRVLLWGYYVIPHWHLDRYRIVYWNKFGRPEKPATYSLGFLDTWWVDPSKH